MKIDRVVLCYRWNWCWIGFWRGWWAAMTDVWTSTVLLAASLAALIASLVVVIAFPIWRLLVEPLIVARKVTPEVERRIRNGLRK